MWRTSMAPFHRSRMWVALALLALVGCLPQHPQSSRPVELADELPGQIVVDFKDGTTQAQIDAWEQQWGVDLHFNSVEGPQDGVAIATGVRDVEGTLAKIRRDPNVESAEPMF